MSVTFSTLRKVSLPSRRLTATTALGFGVMAAWHVAMPGIAFANCVFTPDVICDGGTGANTIDRITGFNSVTFQNKETQTGTNGFAVTGNATLGASGGRWRQMEPLT